VIGNYHKCLEHSTSELKMNCN